MKIYFLTLAFLILNLAGPGLAEAKSSSSSLPKARAVAPASVDVEADEDQPARVAPEQKVQATKKRDGLLKDFDTLGGNDVLLEKAKALNPDASVRVVQNRIVNRRKRLEFAPEYSSVVGGDPYAKTQNVGVNVHFHINPYWSLGVKYNYSFNDLRPEGESLISDPNLTNGHPLIADIDYPKSQYMALVNFYPFYGKLNMFDLGVAHFDVYAIGGYGQIQLKSGNHPTYTAGGGVGFWLSQHLSARAEVRYQGYKAQHYNGEVSMDTTILGLQFGYLL